MINKEKILKVFKNALTSGNSPEKLALSICFGIYIAFSPFPGGHTLMMLAAKALFDLNLPVLFIITSINNPWTMVAFFGLDYAFGYWFLHGVMNLSPAWIFSYAKLFGDTKICLWSFIIGGNILGIIFALVSYIPIKTVLVRISDRKKEDIGEEL